MEDLTRESQTSKQQSSEPVVNKKGSDLDTAQQLTILECSLNLRERAALLASHTETVLSAEQDTIEVFGNHFISNTAFLCPEITL
jgi:hypothetical protein